MRKYKEILRFSYCIYTVVLIYFRKINKLDSYTHTHTIVRRKKEKKRSTTESLSEYKAENHKAVFAISWRNIVLMCWRVKKVFVHMQIICQQKHSPTHLYLETTRSGIK